MKKESQKEYKRIKYIVSYDCPENYSENRVNILASSNKIDYIVHKINEIGYGVDLISTSQTKNNKFYRGKLLYRGVNTLRLFPTTPRGGIIKKVINLIVMRTAIAIYLLKNVKRGEAVIIYHSYGNMWMINLLKHIKGARIIEEVEEIYGDIYGKPRLSRKEKHLLSKADAYIFPTELLNKVVNNKGKNYIIIHGSYKLGNCENLPIKHSARDGLYHVGYTGILDPKKGCLDFIRSAEYLDSSYCLHVLGFGSEKELNLLLETIEYMKEKTNCQIVYDGIKRGSDYDRYLQELDAGICPLNSEDFFVNTQFPSKVISYLANGISVICSNVASVKTSDVSDYITFYEGNSPSCIANAIKMARECKHISDSRQAILQCDKKFGKELKEFFKKEVNHL